MDSDGKLTGSCLGVRSGGWGVRSNPSSSSPLMPALTSAIYVESKMGVDNDLHPLEKRIEENKYGEK
ncbi:jg9581 [Pararge aegeria aegeria]|uniref:Jg9581 protein n=1 Tax=Pararge aegeria aegeria TaxID=348720 RepID=A0A8S4S8D1_9NEOP|nr:jg9581 [Pararge aegeria aegeria]